MNIFVLDYDTEKCAQYHCDKHVVKMILESAQLLSSAHQYHGYQEGYKMSKGHMNHPCSIWVFNLAQDLGFEYTYRYGKQHKSIEVIDSLPYPGVLPDKELTKFAKAFGDYEHLKQIEDPVLAYREYYKLAKADIVAYNKGRDFPDWYLK
jgi:hypothetical protein